MNLFERAKKITTASDYVLKFGKYENTRLFITITKKNSTFLEKKSSIFSKEIIIPFYFLNNFLRVRNLISRTLRLNLIIKSVHVILFHISINLLVIH